MTSSQLAHIILYEFPSGLIFATAPSSSLHDWEDCFHIPFFVCSLHYMIFIYSQLLTILHVSFFGIQIVPAGD